MGVETRVSTSIKGQFARINKDYEYHESLQGKIVEIKRVLPDGVVAVVVHEGSRQGDVVILSKRFLEPFS
jgi:hypothetical protein